MALWYLGKRVVHGLAVTLGVAAIVFAATRFLADPAAVALPLNATEDQYEVFNHEFGLDQPLPLQFVSFLEDIVTFDFGKSISLGQPVTDLVLDRLPRTFVLLVVALGIALLLALPLGVLAALRPGSKLDSLTVTVSLSALSLPQFWFAQLLILLFAVNLNLLPTSGTGGARHLVLPALALGLPSAGRIAQIVRTTMIDELHRQYVLAARARGLSYGYILGRHVLRNALVPITSFVSLELARTFAVGTAIVETVFAYPGFGQLAVQAALGNDVFLMQAVVVVAALIVVGVNLLSDLLLVAIDPRVRLAR